MKALKITLKYTLIIVTIGIIVVISTVYSDPIIKYQLRCIEPSEARYTEIIEELNHRDSVNFCIDDIQKIGANGFYNPSTSRAYIDKALRDPARTIYHEYSHHLMKLRGKDEVEPLFYRVDEESITDIIAYRTMKQREYTITIEDFKHSSQADLDYTTENDTLSRYISDTVKYEIEGGNGENR